jgi:hypothetical protein
VFQGSGPKDSDSIHPEFSPATTRENPRVKASCGNGHSNGSIKESDSKHRTTGPGRYAPIARPKTYWPPAGHYDRSLLTYFVEKLLNGAAFSRS